LAIKKRPFVSSQLISPASQLLLLLLLLHLHASLSPFLIRASLSRASLSLGENIPERGGEKRVTSSRSGRRRRRDTGGSSTGNACAQALGAEAGARLLQRTADDVVIVLAR